MPAVMQSISGKAGRDLKNGKGLDQRFPEQLCCHSGQSWESRNLFEVITHIQQHEGIQLEVKAVR